MQLPQELAAAIDALSEGHKLSELQAACAAMSETYRGGGSSHSLFHNNVQMLAYLATRLPATLAATHAVLQEVRRRGAAPTSLLDLGAGPGSASWAALEAFPEIEQVHLLERESTAIAVGKQLAAQAPHAALREATWLNQALESPSSWPRADLAVASYVLGELSDPAAFVERLLRAEIPLIALIEPGTPQGFERIRAARAAAIRTGARILAPCPHQLACPMQAPDWCHFAARIERTRLHRQLKGGSLGYEDEKFSYVVLDRRGVELGAMEGRVVRPPEVQKGFVRLPLCAADGVLRDLVVPRKDKERYRAARDATWGSSV